MLKIKRFKELVALFFTYLKEEGAAGTIKRAAAFFRRRMKSRKGRFLPPAAALEEQKKYIPPFENKTISVITALYNTDPAFLKEFIDSFLNQSYQYGQLVLADASDADHAYVGEYVRSLDSEKIVYVKLENNGGISENTNRAVKYAGGDYICLADHDDILSPDALYQMAKRIRDTGADFVYSDEALFDTDWTNPIVAHFKPDFSLFYLTNCNYICHLACMKKRLFEALGGLKKEYDGAQDHDLFLKVRESGAKISHIPKVLYYWRVHSASTSGGMEAKPYVTRHGVAALQAHLDRCGIAAKAKEGMFPGTYKADYTIENPPLVSIIIPNKDRKAVLEKCIDSIYEKTTYPNFEILVVENNSETDEIFRYYDRLEKRHNNLQVLKYQGPFNFSAINNFAARRAKGEMLLLLNNDIEIITPGWIEEMAGIALQKDVGIVGAMLYYPNDTVQHAGVITGLGGFAGHSHKYHPRGRSGYMFRLACVQNLSRVTAACLLVTRQAFDAVGGLDEGFAVAFNDVDFCLRVKQRGYQVVFTPYARCYHHESISRGLDKKGEKKERFDGEKQRLKDRFGDKLLKDEFYNPNLTLDMEDFSESRVLPKYDEV